MNSTTEISGIEQTLELMGISGDNVTDDFALWLHTRVLEDALEVLGQRKNEAAKADALSWIISDDRCEFSFSAVAEHLDVEVGILRKQILSKPVVKAAMADVREWLATEAGRQAERRLEAETAHQIRLIEMAKSGKLTRADTERRVIVNVKAEEMPKEIIAVAAEAVDVLVPLTAAVESADRAVAIATEPVVVEAAEIALANAVRKYNDAGAVIWDKLIAAMPDVAKHVWYPYIDPGVPIGQQAIWQAVDDMRELALGPPAAQRSKPGH